ncbi:MAG: Uma2 family endonuclease [Dehalococcoidia bacterium]
MVAALARPRPHLENGDVMSRAEFHALYADCEEYERVELIEGVVYMPSPVRVTQHARHHTMVLRWLMAYEAQYEDVEAMAPASVLLDDQNEPIPDAMLYRPSRARLEGGYLASPPELIVEIAASTKNRDLHQKQRAYERNGVGEYLVWRVEDGALDWFALRDGAYVRREPGPHGAIESEQFPGLRLDVHALLAMDGADVLRGLTSAG